ncbi:3-oxoacyl-[acyl-carrier-protein] synthase III C-terminal domain-containing protein [Sinorhizobium meliloti]|uniref:3-oxoacyl-[acyl-carrier-protein] synthase III C-terminal domain-containing protein n=1 Tax=Rhizobium meliloti TaxID=382 RepID=UPI0004839E25|nr:3-oxoacyl-[acyl-carrier-protein] synthase III C-terminal domain-containing protein [Sinorhizobium meliloti]
MLTLFDIGLHFPDRVEKIGALAEELALSRDQTRMYARFFGFDSFRCDPDHALAPLLHEAGRLVLERNRWLDDRITHVVYCHTLPSTAVFAGDSHSVLQPFTARGLEAFSVTMNHCASALTALNMLDEILSDDDVALVLIGEKAFHRVVRVIENTTIMGEAGCALLVGRGSGAYHVLGSSTSHDGRFAIITGRPGDDNLDAFGDNYVEFASESIRHALTRFGVGLGDVRCVMPHNVNIPSWSQIAHQIGLDPNRILLSTIARYGHCFGADPFINLLHARHEGVVGPSDLVLLFSIGLGATASSALIQVN